MSILNQFDLIIEECTSKKGNVYHALYVVVNDNKIFVCYVNDNTYSSIISSIKK